MYKKYVEFPTTLEELGLKSPMPVIEVHDIEHFPGYDVRYELIDLSKFGTLNPRMVSAYTSDTSEYIGEPNTAHELCVVRGIRPQLREDVDIPVCTVGFSEQRNAWYGWGPKGIKSFTIGDTVKMGDVLLGRYPKDFKVKTLEDARAMAYAFAEEVS